MNGSTESTIPGVKRIGILTGGGDCPGLNAVIRAVAKDALYAGIEVLGIEDGFLGLIEDRIIRLDWDDVSGILTEGGTILGSSNKANPAKFAIDKDAEGKPIFRDMRDVCLTHIRTHGIDTLICIGGDGTMSGAATFVEAGINCIGVPKTIDNDLWGTDITFGFLTAVEIATEAMDRVSTTAASHHRAMVVEVMGRNAGWIALYSGVASGADIILIPEIEFDFDLIAEVVQRRSTRGRKYTIVCVSEGARPKGGAQKVERIDPTSPDPIRLGGIGKYVSGELERLTGVESRYCVLGHTQRGGTPVAADRVLSTQFGHHAMRLLREGKRNRLVVMQSYKLTDIDIQAAANRQRLVPPDHPLVAAAEAVGTCFGAVMPR